MRPPLPMPMSLLCGSWHALMDALGGGGSAPVGPAMVGVVGEDRGTKGEKVCRLVLPRVQTGLDNVCLQMAGKRSLVG